jgi:hypothetical protein
MFSLVLRTLFGDTIYNKDNTEYVKTIYYIDDCSGKYYKGTVISQKDEETTLLEEIDKEFVENYAIQNKNEIFKNRG